MSHSPLQRQATPKKSSDKEWNPSVVAKGKSSPLRMAEPVHRIPPPGATSFQSVRSVTKSSLQLVKEICLHYVQKCSGQYSDNKAASRYVHQMAEEIIFQLGGVANEIKRTRGEPELYQSLLEEWNEHFPASLGAIGSPKAIAQLVAAQSKEINRLKTELQTEKLNRENDVAGILRSMDAQLHTYRTSVMNDRKQQKIVFDQQVADHEEKLAKIEEQYKDQIARNEQNHRDHIASLQQQFKHQEALQKYEHDTFRKELNANIKQLRQKYHKRIEQLMDRLKRWEAKCKDLRSKYNELAVTLSEDLISSSDCDSSYDDDIASLSDIDEEVDFDFENDEVSPSRAKMHSAGGDQRKKTPKSTATTRNKESLSSKRNAQMEQTVGNDFEMAEKIKQLQDANLILNAQVKRMEKRLIEAQTEVNQKQQEIEGFVDKIFNLMEQQTVLVKKVKTAEDLNEALRRALVVKVDGSDCLCFEGADEIKSIPDVLCHTPHFLEKPDRLAPNRRPKPITTGYKISGHF